MWRCEHIIPERFGHTCQNQSILPWLNEKRFCVQVLFIQLHVYYAAYMHFCMYGAYYRVLYAVVLHTEVEYIMLHLYSTLYSSGLSMEDSTDKEMTLNQLNVNSATIRTKPLNNSWVLLHTSYVPRNRRYTPTMASLRDKRSTGYRALTLLSAFHRSGA